MNENHHQFFIVLTFYDKHFQLFLSAFHVLIRFHTSLLKCTNFSRHIHSLRKFKLKSIQNLITLKIFSTTLKSKHFSNNLSTTGT